MSVRAQTWMIDKRFTSGCVKRSLNYSIQCFLKNTASARTNTVPTQTRFKLINAPIDAGPARTWVMRCNSDTYVKIVAATEY